MTKVVKNPATAPGIKYGGRKKGTPNKSTMTVAELCEKMGLNVIENLIHFAKGDHDALGYPEKVVRPGFGGVEIEEYTITPEERYKANLDLAKFIYPTRKAVEHKVDEETSKAFKIQWDKPPSNGKA